MAAVPGADSIRLLHDTLAARFGSGRLRWVGQPGGEVDAIGWRLEDRPRYLFSASTHAGELSLGVYDLQVSVADVSLENGDIAFLDDVDLPRLCEVVEAFASGKAV